MSKCIVGVEEAQFLGYKVNGQGVRTDESKVSAVQNWPQPKTVSDVQFKVSNVALAVLRCFGMNPSKECAIAPTVLRDGVPTVANVRNGERILALDVPLQADCLLHVADGCLIHVGVTVPTPPPGLSILRHVCAVRFPKANISI